MTANDLLRQEKLSQAAHKAHRTRKKLKALRVIEEIKEALHPISKMGKTQEKFFQLESIIQAI